MMEEHGEPALPAITWATGDSLAGGPEDPTLSLRGGATAGTLGGPARASLEGVGGWHVTVSGEASSQGAEGPGPAVGAGYRLRRRIGAGGMGEVWDAVQESLARPVAVKRVRGGRRALPEENSEWMRRELDFRQEALVSARLEHPNIVPVHDFGVDEEGRPLLAMKLVHGTPWNVLVEEERDDAPVVEYLQRHLEVLIQVGQAVAFAHSRGIVHRDLKCSQVMVGEFGEVLLMDWGLAVFVGEEATVPESRGSLRLTSRETATSPSGTPAMMAPEQTADSALGIGAWTDVYLLGGILYQLLTGTFPHRAGSAREAVAKAARGEIEHPSARCPGREHPPELVELCLKALARDPGGRVESASAFVGGLRDYLSGASRRRQSMELARAAGARLDAARGDYAVLAEILDDCRRARELWPSNSEAAAVEARALGRHARAALAAGDLRLAHVQAQRLPESDERSAILSSVQQAEAHARRQARQRRMALQAAAALALVLVLGAVGFAATIQRSNARLELANERIVAQRDSGERVLAFMVEDLSGKLQALDRIELLEGVAQEALAYYDALETDNEPPEAVNRRARAYRALADVVREQGDLSLALEIADRGLALVGPLLEEDAGNRAFLQSRNNLWVSRAEILRQSGRTREALEHHEKALVVARELASGDGAEYWSRKGVGEVLLKAASLHVNLSGLETAGPYYEEALERSEQLVLDRPEALAPLLDLASSQLGVGNLREFQGDIDAAEALYRDALSAIEAALAMEPDNKVAQRQATYIKNYLGDALLWTGRTPEAMELYQESLAMRERLAAEDPSNLGKRLDVSAVLNKIAYAHFMMGNVEEGLEQARRYHAMVEELASIEPGNITYLDELATACAMVAGLSQNAGDMEGALAFSEAAVAAGERTVAADPSHIEFRSTLAVLYSNLYHSRDAAGRVEEARQALEKSIALRAQLHREQPGDTRALLAYAEALLGGGSESLGDGELAAAEEQFQTAEALLSAALGAAPSDMRLLEKLLRVHTGLVKLHEGRKAPAQVLAAAERAVELASVLVEAGAGEPIVYEAAGSTGAARAGALVALGRPEEALDALALARDHVELGELRHPSGRGFKHPLFAVLRRESAIRWFLLGDRDAAARVQSQAVEAYRQGLPDAGWELAPARLAHEMAVLALLGEQPGEEGLALAREALKLAEEMVEAHPGNGYVLRSRAHASVALARELAAAGERAEAEALLEQAGTPYVEAIAALEPPEGVAELYTLEIAFHLAQAWREMGDTARAMDIVAWAAPPALAWVAMQQDFSTSWDDANSALWILREAGMQAEAAELEQRLREARLLAHAGWPGD